jgi:hypothetical protein
VILGAAFLIRWRLRDCPLERHIRPDSGRFIFDWADSYLARNYQLDGIADILASGSEYVWGAAALNYRIRSPYFVSVYRRVSY